MSTIDFIWNVFDNFDTNDWQCAKECRCPIAICITVLVPYTITVCCEELNACEWNKLVRDLRKMWESVGESCGSTGTSCLRARETVVEIQADVSCLLYIATTVPWSIVWGCCTVSEIVWQSFVGPRTGVRTLMHIQWLPASGLDRE